jgi:hypothetical protein
MKTLNRIAFIFAFVCAVAFAQTNTLTQTSLSSAALATDKVINVSSATGINAPNLQSGTVGSQLYLVAPGNPRGVTVLVTSVSSTAIGIRPTQGGAMTALPSGSMVLAGQPNWFYSYEPSGGCTAANTLVTPWVNVKTGNQWLCSTITLSWVPGFQNTVTPAQATAAVASVAGLTAIAGPLLHVTGTNAITGFTMGAGWQGGSFCAIPDGAFTVTATNNVAKASTAVVNKPLCWLWDSTNSLFVPTY